MRYVTRRIIEQKDLTNTTRMLCSSPLPTPRQPRKSNALMSPLSLHKKPSVSPAIHRTRRREKKARSAALIGLFRHRTATHRTREMANEVRMTSIVALNITTETTSMISSIFLDRQTPKHSTHTTTIGLHKSTAGHHETTWLQMRSCWRGLAMLSP